MKLKENELDTREWVCENCGSRFPFTMKEQALFCEEHCLIFAHKALQIEEELLSDSNQNKEAFLTFLEAYKEKNEIKSPSPISIGALQSGLRLHLTRDVKEIAAQDMMWWLLIKAIWRLSSPQSHGNRVVLSGEAVGLLEEQFLA